MNLQRLQARQNALLALNLAVGELQQLTGPDQRVTATADIAAEADGSRLAAGGVAKNTQSVNGTSNGLSESGAPSVQTGSRWWTGVWGRAGTSYSIPANSIYEETPSPVLLNWLVSGNENNVFSVDSDGWVVSSDPSSFTPGDSIDWSTAGLDPADPASWSSSTSYAGLEIQASGQKAVLLVGPGTAGVNPIDGENASERYVIAPMQDIAANSGTNSPSGRYAWWVGDEGVKASYALNDPYAGSESPDANNSAGAEARLRLMSAARSGIEMLPGWDTYPGADDASAAEYFTRFNAMSQAKLISPNLTDETIAESFHDITLYSKGLLTDVLNGGLKTDLTYYFESSSNWNSSSLKGNAIIEDSYSPDWGSGNYAPKWDWLYSFYNTNPSLASQSLTIRPETATELSVSPIITQLRMIFFTEDPRINNVKTLPAGEDFTLPLRCNIAIVLANPYNFSLNVPADELEFVLKNDGKANLDRGLIIRVARGQGKGTTLATYGILRGPDNTTETTGMLDTVKLTVPNSFTIAPGQTVTLAVEGNHQVLSGNNDPVDDPVNTIQLSVRTASNPILTSNYFSAADTLDFSTYDSTGSFSDVAATLFQYDSDFNLTMRSPTSEIYQRIEHFRIGKGSNQVISFAGTVMGSAHLKFIAPAQRTMDWTSPSSLKYEFSYYVTSRPFQDFNIRSKTISNPNVYYNGGDNVLNSPPSYGAGVIRNMAGGSAGTNIFSAFTDSLHPAQWAEDFNDDIRQSALSGVLYDFPRRSADQLPVVSLAQLQHANISTDDETLDGTINFVPGYAVGNSYFNPFVTRGQSIETRRNDYSLATNGSSASTRYFDLSYLLNTALWDSYYFSGIPQSGSDYEPLNLRYQLEPDATSNDARSPQSAEQLSVKGAFNINSTSKDAWVALLSGMNDLRVNDDTTADGVPFPRTLWQTQHSVDTSGSFQTSGSGDNAYAGYRRLTSSEIDLLAGEMVKRVRARGPFVTLSQFINRTLVPASDDFNEDINDADGDGNLASPTVPQGRGLSGPLQAAIDSEAAGINSFIQVGGIQVEADAAGEYGDRVLFNGEVASSLSHKADSNNSRRAYFSDKEFDNPHIEWDMNQSAKPGPYGRTTTASAAWLMQGDILQAIGSALLARSDTFVIRTYGEVLSPVDSSTALAGAWCEAVVQRTVDYVDSDADAATDGPSALGAAVNRDFGRRYKIVSFRWLSADEI
ncbi:hypothetical protein [Coraliomargarita parva]|uniref:hypothetical protein n=1 Tax=Coraliomargarita parva TaxID=3014050 RepID=UPI0022B316A4|nr:hypothetical protein [Coraliomargarita parva]